MATITAQKLTLTHNHTQKTAKAVVTCQVNFTAYERSEMSKGLRFKLTCKLWGEDSGLTGADDFLFSYPTAFFFPDATPTSPENRTFDIVLGEGVLDEDWGVDEVYGRLRLTNLYTLVAITKRTNVVSHSF